MTSSRGHQGALGLGQAEKQLDRQIKAGTAIQGENPVDQAIVAASHEHASELDDIIVKYEE
ncbi:hypothetical protein [Paenibacillus xanthanilyticus]|uniref:Uncharacterized protein n=1 Tax=Paenibacillus xanthanilyticus TaxID=1783531 RepID=A0ABV8K0V7_9BACL